MSPRVFDRMPVVDVDTHITEPPGTWSSRVASRWGDQVPHVERTNGRDYWVSGDKCLAVVGQSAMAGHDGYFPDSPRTYDDMHPGAWDPHARLAYMDEQQIAAQVLYPNLGGFGAGYWLQVEHELALECVRAYNDFLHEFCSAAPRRLLPITAIPFWDLDSSLAEIERCFEMGHRGINFCNQPESYGQPPLPDPHWDPVWRLAAEAGLPVSFHVGGGDIGAILRTTGGLSKHAHMVRVSSLLILDNMRCIGDLICGGICHRFPDTNFVSVESGVGYLPSYLEALDWQWQNSAIALDHPEYDLLPSEYFERQIYGCFWFERDSAISAIERYPHNLLFETDFPHPTCQHPGPASIASEPRKYVEEAFGSLPEESLRSVLYGNASRIYQLGDLVEC